MKKMRILSMLMLVFLSLNIGRTQINDPRANGQIQQPPITDDTYFDDDAQPQQPYSGQQAPYPPQQQQPPYPQQQPPYNGQQGPPPQVSYEPFYNDLAPYGTWTNYGSYGYVWIPSVEAGFQPYSTNGHWVMTDYGWTWASNYQWGWAAFHYGRWAYESRFGWMWIPGRTWGPAWVSWRQNDQYYGWAPLGPHRAGMSVAISIPIDHYCFAPIRYMTQSLVSGYIVNRTQNAAIINSTIIVNNARMVNNTRVVGGPAREHFERISGQRIDAYAIREDRNARIAAVNGGHYDIYRPQMAVLKNNAAVPRPNRVESERNIRPQNQSQQLTPTVQRTTEGARRRDNNDKNGNRDHRRN